MSDRILSSLDKDVATRATPAGKESSLHAEDHGDSSAAAPAHAQSLPQQLSPARWQSLQPLLQVGKDDGSLCQRPPLCAPPPPHPSPSLQSKQQQPKQQPAQWSLKVEGSPAKQPVAGPGAGCPRSGDAGRWRTRKRRKNCVLDMWKDHVAT